MDSGLFELFLLKHYLGHKTVLMQMYKLRLLVLIKLKHRLHSAQ